MCKKTPNLKIFCLKYEVIMLKICNILLCFYGFGFMAVITRQQASVEHSEKLEIKHPVAVLRNGEDQTSELKLKQMPELCLSSDQNYASKLVL